MSLRVAVLAQHSLFAEGLATRLREYKRVFEVFSIDATVVEDAIRRLLEAEPTIVIVDANDAGLLKEIPVTRLLNLLPGARVIQIDADSDRVQVFFSEQRYAPATNDLVSMMHDIAAV